MSALAAILEDTREEIVAEVSPNDSMVTYAERAWGSQDVVAGVRV